MFDHTLDVPYQQNETDLTSNTGHLVMTQSDIILTICVPLLTSKL